MSILKMIIQYLKEFDWITMIGLIAVCFMFFA